MRYKKFFLLENYFYHNDGVLIRCDNNHKYHLPNQENKVLKSLIKHSGRVISKQVLIEESWGHLDVSDESLSRCVYSLRKLLFDNGKEFIKSVYAKGYLLRSAEMVSKRESPQCEFGVLIYPFSCENSLDLQYSLIKLLVEKNEFNIYPASLIGLEQDINKGNKSTFKVMGSAISNKEIRLEIVDGESNYLIDSELVDNDINSILGGVCGMLDLMIKPMTGLASKLLL